MTTKSQLLNYARTWLNTPFHHQGRNRAGVDCIGLLVVIANHFGLPTTDTKDYDRTPDGFTLQREFAKCMIPVQREGCEVGDVLTFWVRKQGMVQHASIVTDKGMIHSYFTVGKVVETDIGHYWGRRLAQCYRFPDVVSDIPRVPAILPAVLPDPAEIMHEKQVLSMGTNCCGG